MRTSFLFGLALTLSLSFQVAADEETVVKPNFDGLGNVICNEYNSSELVNSTKYAILDYAEKFYNEPFIRYTDKTPSPEKTEELRKVVGMMNQNAGEIKCGGKHFIHYAFEMGKYHEVVGLLLFNVLADKDKGIHYDFNAITMTEDPTTEEVKYIPMTVLDYIDKVAMNTPSISKSETDKIRINAIRRTMVKHFGAVRYEDLSDDKMARTQTENVRKFGESGEVVTHHLNNMDAMLKTALGNGYADLRLPKKNLISEFERAYAKRPPCAYSEDDVRYLLNHRTYIHKGLFGTELRDVNELTHRTICSFSDFRLGNDLLALLNEFETKTPRPSDTKPAYIERCKNILRNNGTEGEFVGHYACVVSEH